MRTRFTMTLLALLGAVPLGASQAALADDKALIDANTERALTWMRASGGDTSKLLDRAAGVLIFPDIVKMGFGAGGQFGEGALVVDGETVAYYATAGNTFGNLPDAEYKAEVIFFMTDEALMAFRNTPSWKVGEHATVPVMTDAALAAADAESAHIGVIFSEDGLVRDLNFDGSRVRRISR
jgi:lipid-binding SYLF domain-containing protein